jgi:hypothetical protein
VGGQVDSKHECRACADREEAALVLSLRDNCLLQRLSALLDQMHSHDR